MSIVQLPIAKSPIVGLQYTAYTLNILLNYEDSLPWFYSNYIQLFWSSKKPLNFYPNSFSENPLLSCQVLKKEIIETHNINIHDFIIDCINSKEYFYSQYDEYYVPNRRFYGNTHLVHDFMIYGYDADKKEYSIMGFNQKYDYGTTKISFEQFEKAFFSDSAKLEYIHILSKKENVKYEFDLQLVYEMLYDYYNSRNSSERCRMHKNTLVDMIFGMDIYKNLVDYFRSLIDEGFGSDFTIFHTLLEHKECMLLRLEYMYNNKYIDDYKYLYEGFKNLAGEMVKMRNLHFKYFISKNKGCLEKIIKKLTEIEQKERDLLENMLNKIYHQLEK